ncbi:MAG: helix-turn-helix domain-containing protein [Desulfovibrio sp.]|jgi:transcriptional regulator with XRE-family HTH domain|nr:helix-turn-helix domain-containing protein [Desulfovibrio sp.]
MGGFSDRIKSLRELAGLTTEEFAKILGIGAGTLNSYERGKTTPSGKKLIRISEQTGKSIEWLLSGAESEKTGDTSPVFEDVKTQHPENTTLQTMKEATVAGFDPSLYEKINTLYENNAALLREIADLRMENGNLRVENERLKARQAVLEREAEAMRETPKSEAKKEIKEQNKKPSIADKPESALLNRVTLDALLNKDL